MPLPDHRESPERSPLVLGIDPGLQRTGYGVLAVVELTSEIRVIEAGLIRLTRGTPLVSRLLELEDSLTKLIQQHRPTVLACEQLYAHYKHPRTAILMAHARGVILATAARAGLAVLSVAATNVKKLLTGSGRAGKRQVQLAVTATLRLPAIPEPNDVADALAIALCGLRLHAANAAAADCALQSRPNSPSRPVAESPLRAETEPAPSGGTRRRQ